jgi:signal-transduction protein with cAMP-binding, CBS, and nucleotidyltransferase domain
MALPVVDLHSPVSLIIRCPAPRIPNDATLTHASQVMRAQNSSALLVGPGHTAIITERDLTRALASEFPPQTPVGKVATPLPLSVPAETDILTAGAKMLNEEVRHLIVELPDGNEGIVSLRQIMAVLLQAAQPELWLTSLRVRVEMPELWLG